MITQASVEEAHWRLRPFIHCTPVLTSAYIDWQLGASVYFKCENFQKTGSFKARGALNAVLRLPEEEKARGVVTHSSGNHGQALAWAARQAGMKARVVMPSDAPQVKKDAVKGYGAEVTECEPTLEARESAMEAVREATGAVFIPPYNFHPVIEGQATAAKEIFEEGFSPDCILAPVGGGGLLSGSALSTIFFHPGTQVIGCEPERADDAFRSYREGKRLPSVKPETIADWLRTSLGEITFAYIREYVADILLCPEDAIIEAMKMIAQRMKIIIEPSAAVPLACMLRHKERFRGKKVALILSGGNVDVSDLPF